MHLYLIIALVSYLLGSIPFGYILVRVFLRTDVRTLGSGNIGATNVGRTGHKGLAIATLLLDAGKGALAVWHAQYAAHSHLASEGHLGPSSWPLVLASMAAMFAVLGHVFPLWLKFKGGKGVATAVGAFALLAPRAVLVALAVFLVTVAITRFVSLGSILGAAAFPVAVWWLDGRTFGAAAPHILGSICITSALVIVKHHANIRRLLSGTENKFGAKAVPANPIPTEKNA